MLRQSTTTFSVDTRARGLAPRTWQGIDLREHRTRPHRREVALHVLGE